LKRRELLLAFSVLFISTLDDSEDKKLSKSRSFFFD